jgi:hypothetical protein
MNFNIPTRMCTTTNRNTAMRKKIKGHIILKELG